MYSANPDVVIMISDIPQRQASQHVHFYHLQQKASLAEHEERVHVLLIPPGGRKTHSSDLLCILMTREALV